MSKKDFMSGLSSLLEGNKEAIKKENNKAVKLENNKTIKKASFTGILLAIKQ